MILKNVDQPRRWVTPQNADVRPSAGEVVIALHRRDAEVLPSFKDGSFGTKRDWDHGPFAAQIVVCLFACGYRLWVRLLHLVSSAFTRPLSPLRLQTRPVVR